MEKNIQKSLLLFIRELTDIQIVTLVYHCLNCSPADIYSYRKVSKQAVSQSMTQIIKKRNHQELIAALQDALSVGGFVL